MPISILQLLDLIIALVLLMFVPIGYWRGALREWVTCAGILLGLLLAIGWSGSWGPAFSTLLQQDAKLASFTVGAIVFLLIVLFVGYGSGVTLPYRPDLSIANRLLGAAVGLGNGMLIMSGLLQLMQLHLFTGNNSSPLHTARLSILLTEQVRWVYLFLVMVLLGLIIAGLVRRVLEGTPILEEYSPLGRLPLSQQADATSERSAPILALPAPATTGAANDDPETTSLLPTASTDVVSATGIVGEGITGDGAASSAEEAPLIPAPAGPLPIPFRTPIAQIVNLARRQAPSGTATRASAPATPPKATSEAAATPAPPDEHMPTEEPDAEPTPAVSLHTAVEAAEPVEGKKGCCPICGSAIRAEAKFCGVCGHLLFEQEQRQIARQL